MSGRTLVVLAVVVLMLALVTSAVSADEKKDGRGKKLDNGPSFMRKRQWPGPPADTLNDPPRTDEALRADQMPLDQETEMLIKSILRPRRHPRLMQILLMQRR